MSSGELSFESLPSLSVTWSIPDFFRLATESDHSLRSPDFTFADGRYRLRLFQIRKWVCNYIGIELMNSNDRNAGRAALYEVVLKSGTEEIDMSDSENYKKVFRLRRSDLEDLRELFVPDGTFTVLCFVRSREPDSAVSPKSGWAQTRVIRQYRMTGNLSSESFLCLCVTWIIPEFFRLAEWPTRILFSPKFNFSDGLYNLRLFPNRTCWNVYIHLVNWCDPLPGRNVSYKIGLKSTSGEEIYIDEDGPSTKRNFLIARSDLNAMQPVRFPDGQLTVFCCMRSREPSSAGSQKSGGTETPGSKVSVPQAAARPKPSGAETSDEEKDKEVLPGLSKLSSDLRQLLQKMPDSDASVVVSGKEFRAHKVLLRARSTVFDDMFGHETAERASGRVVIDDLDPGCFGDFLEYLYTGTVASGLSENNAFGLYRAADKYDVPTLKAECVAHMGRSLSLDSFCDVIAVALQHSDGELLSKAVRFFKENMARIIVTVKWQQFVIDYGRSANELCIRAVVPPGQ